MSDKAAGFRTNWHIKAAVPCERGKEQLKKPHSALIRLCFGPRQQMTKHGYKRSSWDAFWSTFRQIAPSLPIKTRVDWMLFDGFYHLPPMLTTISGCFYPRFPHASFHFLKEWWGIQRNLSFVNILYFHSHATSETKTLVHDSYASPFIRHSRCVNIQMSSFVRYVR